MRVLQLIMKPQRRGAETFALDLSRWLDGHGHASRIVALYPHVGPPLALRAGDVVLDGKERGRRERLADPLLLAALVQSVVTFRPDVIVANGGRTLKYAALLRPLVPGGALWVYRNIGNPLDWLKSRLARAMLPRLVPRTFDAAVAVSETTLGQVRAIYGFEGNSVAIENGVDFARLVPTRQRAASRALLAESALRHVVLWAGAFGADKRPDVAVDVIHRLNRSDVGLAMLGDGPWRERVEQQVARLGLQAQVRLLGSRADMGDLLRAADALLLTSETEGIPAVVLEAAHCGLPAVAFDVGGMRECVRDGETGVLVAHGDLLGLASELDAVLQDDGRRDAQGRAAAQFAAKFSIDEIGERYLAFFEDQRTHLLHSAPGNAAGVLVLDGARAERGT